MSSPQGFKAAVVAEQGASNIVTERSLTPPQGGEVIVKITATAINPVDWKIRDYGWFVDSFPNVLGSDAAGEIVAVGPGVSDVKTGDRVMFQGLIGSQDASTFQQYAKVPAVLVSKIPHNVSDDEAAGILVAIMAVIVGFYDKTGYGVPAPWENGGQHAGRGRAVIILGGSSSVGQYAIQLARLSGYDRIITNSSTAHRELLIRLGAHVVLDRFEAGPEDFRTALGDLPLDFVYDSVSTVATETLGMEILRVVGTNRSKFVVIQPLYDEIVASAKAQEPRLDISFILSVGHFAHLRYLSEPLMKYLGGDDGWLATGRIVPNRVVIIDGGLDKVDEALERNKKGMSGEKLILHPWDNAM